MKAESLPNWPGSYILEIEVLHSIEIKVGAKGKYLFKTGIYYYAGSAKGQGGIQKRVARYLTLNKIISSKNSGMNVRPKMHWHIDYLLKEQDVVITSLYFSSKLTECDLAKHIENQSITEIPVSGFGASDCGSGCKAHLFHTGKEKIALNRLDMEKITVFKG